jgi:hypothetical protein
LTFHIKTFFFLAVLKFELRASSLLGRYYTTWASPPSQTGLGLFLAGGRALGFELRALCLLGKQSTTWVMNLALFAFVTLFLCWWDWGLNWGLYAHKADSTAWATHPVHFALQIGFCKSICLGWPWT